jgi:NTE family protein
MDEWRDKLVKWRCSLPEAERRKFGAPPGWNCHDVKFFIGRIAFEQLGPERAAQLNAVETRFKLPPQQVDMLIDAGRDALRANKAFRDFLNSMQSAPPRVPPRAPTKPTPVAAVPWPAAPPPREAKAD